MADPSGLYGPRPALTHRAADLQPAAPELTSDAIWAGHLLDTTRRPWLAGAIPDADRMTVYVAERAALDAAIRAAFAVTPTCDPARAACKRPIGGR